MANINNCGKLDVDLLHMLPFLPSRKRQKGFEVVRRWGKKKMTVRAFETLNYYDLITLLYITQQYILANKEDLEIGEGKGKELINLEINIEHAVKTRNIKNMMRNRETVCKSFARLRHVDIHLDDDYVHEESWLIFSVKFDVKFKNCTVSANKKFLDYCVKTGLMCDFKRLTNYKDSGIAVLLDAFLQSTKTASKKGVYMYRSTYKEDTLFDAVFYNSTMSKRNMRQKVSLALKTISAQKGMPIYAYDKLNKSFNRVFEVS